MNPVNPKKLLRSKWTAVEPTHREKHFDVVRVMTDDGGVPYACVLRAIHSGREFELDWTELKDEGRWRIGWV